MFCAGNPPHPGAPGWGRVGWGTSGKTPSQASPCQGLSVAIAWDRLSPLRRESRSRVMTLVRANPPLGAPTLLSASFKHHAPIPRSGSCTKSPAFPTPGLHPITQPYPGGVAATTPRLFIVLNSNHKSARFSFEQIVERKRHPKTAAPEAQPGDGPTTVQRPTNENLWLSKSTLAHIYK
jgi:hypothetical protein